MGSAFEETPEERLFKAALAFAEDEREAFVKSSAGDDEELYQIVIELLDGYEQSGGDVKEDTLIDDAVSRQRWGSSTEQPGVTIGPFTLVRQVGEGGMGTVWEATQSVPIARRVALKLIKLGMDTAEVVQRFERERQTLAMMEHPNIAAVHEAGATALGRPYFAMEFVEGEPITDYGAQHDLSVDDRLHLMLTVCAGIEHAHRKGVIHRDLKPTNILVSKEGVPKIIDFGIAKAAADEGGTMFTRASQMLGTPAYMSPEQASGLAKAIDTRSDVYSLGVVLYELLAGAPPFDPERLASTGIAELQKIISEEEPPTPSTRQTNSKPPTSHSGPPTPNFKKDLDWIVMKAMAKEPERRYQSAAALGEDLQRFLDGEAVTAVPPTAAYRFGKFVRRNKLGVGAAAAVFLAFMLGGGLAVWQAVRATTHAAKSEANLVAAHRAEGKAWLERAMALSKEKKPFQAKLMAARSIGFQGAGGESMAPEFREQHPILLPADSEDARIAQTLLRSHGDYPMIWQSPSSPHHGGFVHDVAFHPDGNLLASCSRSERFVRVWEPRSGKAAFILQAPRADLTTLDFSPDGKWLAAAGQGPEVLLWNVATQTLTSVFHSTAWDFTDLEFSPTSNLLAGATRGGAILFWDVPNNESLPSINASDVEVIDIGFSRDGQLLSAVDRDSFLRVWSLGDHEERAAIQTPDGNPISTAIAPESGVIFGGLDSGPIQAWDDESLEKLDFAMKTDGHPISQLILSPDQSILASSDWIGTIRLSKTRDGSTVHQLLGHTDRVFALDFSLDGQLLASGSEDGTVRVWDVETGQELHSTLGHTSDVDCIALSPDGRTLASSGEDQTIQFWDLTNGKNAGAITTRELRRIRSIDYSPSGKLILSASAWGTVKFWDSATKRGTGTLVIRHPLWLEAARFRNEEEIVTSGTDGTVRTWSVATGKELTRHTTHTGPVTSLDVSPDGKMIASGSQDRTVVVWEPGSAKPPRQFKGHANMVTAARFSPTGEVLATGDMSGAVRIWDPTSGTTRGSLSSSQQAIYAIDFSPDGRQFAATGADGAIRIWDAETLRLEAVLEGHTGKVGAVQFSFDGTMLATAGDDKTVALWHAQGARVGSREAHEGTVLGILWNDQHLISSGSDHALVSWSMPEFAESRSWRHLDHAPTRLVGHAGRVITGNQEGTLSVWSEDMTVLERTFYGHAATIDGLALSNDGKVLASVASDGQLRLWETRDWTALGSIQLVDDASERVVCFSSDGERVFCTGGNDGTIRVFSVDGLDETDRFSARGQLKVRALDHHPDKPLLAAAFSDGAVLVWNTESKSLVAELDDRSGEVLAVRFSPDGRWLAAGGEGQDVILWETGGEVWREVDRFSAHQGTVRTLCFDPDGRRLVSGAEDGKLHVWSLTQESPERYAADFDNVDISASHFRAKLPPLGASLAVPRQPPVWPVPKATLFAALHSNATTDQDLVIRAIRAENWRAAKQLLPDDDDSLRAKFGQSVVAASRRRGGNQEWLSLAKQVAPHLPALGVAEALVSSEPGRLAAAFEIVPEDETELRATLLDAQLRASLDSMDFAGAREALQSISDLGRVGFSETRFTDYTASHCAQLLAELGEREDETAVALRGFALIESFRLAFSIVPRETALRDRLLNDLVEWESRTIAPPLTMVGEDSQWRYLDDGSNPDAQWMAQDHEDRSWREGFAPLGYSTSAKPSEKRTELRRSPNNLRSEPSWMTFYFRTAFEKPQQSGRRRVVVVETRYDDGVILYLNGKELKRINMAEGAVNHLTAASHYQNRPGLTRFTIPIALLQDHNLLAAEVHQREPSSSDIYFDAHLTAVGSTPGEYIASLDQAQLANALEQAQGLLPPALAARWMPLMRFCFASAPVIKLPPEVDPARAWITRARVQMGLHHLAAAQEAAAQARQAVGTSDQPFHHDVDRLLERLEL